LDYLHYKVGRLSGNGVQGSNFTNDMSQQLIGWKIMRLKIIEIKLHPLYIYICFPSFLVQFVIIINN